MKINEIRVIAKEKGIKTAKMKKTDLVHEIQKAEGNSPCYLAEIQDCGEMQCSWRDDCQIS